MHAYIHTEDCPPLNRIDHYYVYPALTAGEVSRPWPSLKNGERGPGSGGLRRRAQGLVRCAARSHQREIHAGLMGKSWN